MIANVITALGWALLHSLWQGAALSLFLFALLHLLNKSQHRYLIACATLFMLPVGFMSTALWVYTPDVTDTFTSSLTTLWLSTPSLITVGSPGWHASPFSFEPFLPLFFWLWLLGVILSSLRWLSGFIYLERIKAKAQATPEIQASLNALEASLNLRSRPTVALASGLSSPSPLLTGLIKPVILLPVSAASGLTPAQLESILLHELAHLKRYDPLVNRLQAFVEILFFYHPASWYMARQVRREREYCCDDFVLSVTGDRLTYARALTRLETLKPAPAQLALSATGGPFMNRIRRILQPSTGQARAKGAGLILLLSTTLIACSTTLLNRDSSSLETVQSVCLGATVATGSHVMPAFNAASLRAMSKVLSESGLALATDCADAQARLEYTMSFDAQSLSWQAALVASDLSGEAIWLHKTQGDIEEDGAFQYTTESTAETLLRHFLIQN